MLFGKKLCYAYNKKKRRKRILNQKIYNKKDLQINLMRVRYSLQIKKKQKNN